MFQFWNDPAEIAPVGVSSITYYVREGLQNDLPATIRLNILEDDVAGVRDILRDEIENILLQAQQALNADGFDMMGVVIHGYDNNGIPVIIGLPWRPWEALTADGILEAIENKLNSSQTLVMDLRMVFSIRHVEPPLGLHGRSCWRGDINQFKIQKRSIIQINPPNDPKRDLNDCFFQFLAIGYAKLVANEEVPFLEVVPSYKLLVTSGSKFNNRHRAADMLIARFPDITDQSVANLHAIETNLNIRIVLYSVENRFQLLYPNRNCLPVADVKPTIFGLVSNGINDWKHVDYVASPAALLTVKGTIRICYYCFQPYIRSRDCNIAECRKNETKRCFNCHACDGLCWCCYTKDCGQVVPISDDSCEPFLIPKKCPVCKKQLFSTKCEELHVTYCGANSKKKCELCGKADHRSLKCDEIYCMMCSEKCKKYELELHECFLRNEEMKEPSTHYWSYDFETCVNEATGEHVLYLCTAWPLYDHGYITALKECYPHRIIPGYEDRPVFVFWGLGDPVRSTGVYQFFDFICNPNLSGAHFFAHNAGKYDAIFIERYMTLKGLIPQKIQRGLAVMQLKFTDMKLTFKDSLFFIPTRLRAMSADFGIDEVAKGFFPHKLMTVKFMNDNALNQFIIRKPDRKFFYNDFAPGRSGEEEQIELDIFLDEFYGTDDLWDLKEDAIQYCISDTLLLGCTLKVFREKTMELTADVERVDVDYVEFDPLQFVTLPSAVMKFYMSQMLPSNTIGIIDRYPCLVRKEVDTWILYEEKTLETFIQRNIKVGDHVVDGIYMDTTAYMFLPCYDHGCDLCYPGAGRNMRKNKFFHQCLRECRQRLREIQSLGKRVRFMWEHDWNVCKKTAAFIEWNRSNRHRIELRTSLDPREAYKGGISELYKLRVEGNIQMVDFVSQYPTALLGKSIDPYSQQAVSWKLPTGTPIIINKPGNYVVNREILGIAKVCVLPPTNLYAPFLGYKVESKTLMSYEVLYGLCRTCMSERNLQLCTHTHNDDRAIVGTWTLSELYYAMDLGYVILNWFEVWEYPGADDSIFKAFILPFMKTKILCKRKGLVDNDNQFTEAGAQVRNYLESVSNETISADDFKDSPAERTIAKLMMNSFYGKWGQRSVWSETRTFTNEDYSKCLNVLQDPNINVQYAEVMSNGNLQVVVLEFEKHVAVSRGDASKNDHIAAYVTAYGRMMLNQLLQQLGPLAIYSDTDSAYHIQSDVLPYQVGYRFGDLELELPLARNWSGMGRKSYSYTKISGENVCRQKGISLKKSFQHEFTPEKMIDLITRTKAVFDDIAQQENYTQISKKAKKASLPCIKVDQVMFKTVPDKDFSIVSQKKTIRQPKQTRFLIDSLKRVPQWENFTDGVLDTLPFGYK